MALQRVIPLILLLFALSRTYGYPTAESAVFVSAIREEGPQSRNLDGAIDDGQKKTWPHLLRREVYRTRISKSPTPKGVRDQTEGLQTRLETHGRKAGYHQRKAEYRSEVATQARNDAQMHNDWKSFHQQKQEHYEQRAQNVQNRLDPEILKMLTHKDFHKEQEEYWHQQAQQALAYATVAEKSAQKHEVKAREHEGHRDEAARELRKLGGQDLQRQSARPVDDDATVTQLNRQVEYHGKQATKHRKQANQKLNRAAAQQRKAQRHIKWRNDHTRRLRRLTVQTYRVRGQRAPPRTTEEERRQNLQDLQKDRHRERIVYHDRKAQVATNASGRANTSAQAHRTKQAEHEGRHQEATNQLAQRLRPRSAEPVGGGADNPTGQQHHSVESLDEAVQHRRAQVLRNLNEAVKARMEAKTRQKEALQNSQQKEFHQSRQQQIEKESRQVRQGEGNPPNPLDPKVLKVLHKVMPNSKEKKVYEMRETAAKKAAEDATQRATGHTKEMQENLNAYMDAMEKRKQAGTGQAGPSG